MEGIDKEKDYYTILGIPKNASLGEIKNAYRKLAKIYHPDLFPNDKEKEERFKLIKEAYEVLSKEEKREIYDRYGTPRARDGWEYFESTFVSSPKTKRGEDIVKELHISSLNKGLEMKVPFERMEVCPLCQGKGTLSPDDAWQICPTCRGKGKRERVRADLLSEHISSELCPDCGGRGKIPVAPCPRCEGKGRIKKRGEITLKIPPRLKEGQRLVFKTLGNECIDGGKGDLIVVFHLDKDRLNTDHLATSNPLPQS